MPFAERSKKTILGSIAVILSVVVTTASAYAAEPSSFVDVPLTHPYYDVIMRAQQEGIVAGTGNDCFSPDRVITAPEFVAIYTRMMAPDMQTEVSADVEWVDQVYQTGVQAGLITSYEAAHPQVIECTYDWMISKVMESQDIYAYDCQLWGEPHPQGYSVPDGNELISAEHYGFDDGLNIAAYDKKMTRAETLCLLYNIKDADVWNIKPDIVNDIFVDFEDGTESQVNRMYLELADLPDEYIDIWNKSGWSMHVTKTPISQVDEDFAEYTTAVGITSASNKSVWVNAGPAGLSTHTVLHEFGHFMDRYMGRSLPKNIFITEQEAISKFFRPYASSSAAEALADLFHYCVKYCDDSAKMDELSTALPQCYAFMKTTFPELFV